jgi:hypothetical protein
MIELQLLSILTWGRKCLPNLLQRELKDGILFGHLTKRECDRMVRESVTGQSRFTSRLSSRQLNQK